MKNVSFKWKSTALSILAASALLLTGCQNDIMEPEASPEGELMLKGTKVYSKKTVNFNNRGNGTYSSTAAKADFGNVSSWDPYKIQGKAIRANLKKNEVASSSGMLSEIDISDGTEYVIEYDIKFPSGFDWSRGGKCGFGFSIGNGITGGDGSKARKGDGGSFRVMWYSKDRSKTDNTGNVYFKPYIYHMGMKDNYGEDFGKQYGPLKTNKWYRIKLYYKANTRNSNPNGVAKMWVGSTLVLNKSNIKWASSSSSNRKVKDMYFHTFRGGGSSYWGSKKDSYVLYDNVKWNRIKK